MVRRVAPMASIALLACSMPNPDFDRNSFAEETGLDGAGDGDGDAGDGDDGDAGAGDGDAGDGDGDAGDGDGDGDGDAGDGDGDGDGDAGDGDGDGDEPLCGAPLEYLDCDKVNDQVLTEDPFAALGLGCPGPADQTIAITEQSFNALDPASWRIATRFGLAEGPNYAGWLWSARESLVLSPGDDLPDIPPNTSSAILMLTTGLFPPHEPDGGIEFEYGIQPMLGNNLNPGAQAFPPPISPDLGSNDGDGGTPFENCDGINDCSDSLYDQWYVLGWNSLHDQLWLSFEFTPPPEVWGYMFDFAFFSSEYPTFIETPYNDMFVAWSTSETYTGNLTFVGQAPMNTTSLDAVDGFTYTGESPALDGTGFEGHASTSWLLARGPAKPGEAVEVTLYLSDLGDTSLASIVLLDNFRWDCGGCEGMDCGFNP